MTRIGRPGGTAVVPGSAECRTISSVESELIVRAEKRPFRAVPAPDDQLDPERAGHPGGRTAVLPGFDAGRSARHRRRVWVDADGRVRHAITAAGLSNDLAGWLADLVAAGRLDPARFEEAFVAVVSQVDPKWAIFYRNTLAALRDGGEPGGTNAGMAPVHDRAAALAVGDVVELGCCFGFLSLRLAAAGHRVTAVDVVPGTARLLAAVSEELGTPVATLAGDARRIPLADGAADTVLAVHLLEHLPRGADAAVLAEMLRVARRRVVVAVPFEDVPDPAWGHVRTFSPGDLEALGAATGRPFAVTGHHGGWLVVGTGSPTGQVRRGVPREGPPVARRFLYRRNEPDGAVRGCGMVGEDAPAAGCLRLSKFHAPEIVFGHGSLPEAAHGAGRLGARRPFVVTDPGLVEAGWPGELLAHLRRAGLEPQLWCDVSPNPKDHEIEAGFARYVETDCDVVVAVGGGSVMDAAKGIALLAANGGRILDYEGIDRIAHPVPPMVMLPSTSGTGADVSQFCIVTDTARHTKITIMGRALVPDLSVIDPRLLTTMPDDLNAATGLDALTHGIEAFVSLAHGPLTDHHALLAISLVHGNLVRTMLRPDDTAARAAMAQAALAAGLAFTNAILGATHAMSHQVGGMLDLPHGVVNGVLLPHVVRFNGAAVPERFVPIAQAMGLPDVVGAPAGEVVDRVAQEVRRLGDEVGVPKGLGDLGVDAGDIPRLAHLTLGDACLTTNPRPTSQAEVAELFRAAL